MKKRTLLYIPLLVLFVFAASVLVVQYSMLLESLGRPASTVDLPFGIFNGTLVSLKPDAEAAGFKASDRLVAVGGRKIDGETMYREELSKLRPGEPALFTVRRQLDGGETRDYELSLTPKEKVRDFNFYAGQVVGFIFSYFMPTFCVLLGFWVVFARPRDFLAWLLLFIMLGFTSISFEDSPSNFIRAYAAMFFSTWALAMFLFGIYFPEPLSLDRKFPWAKWILIVPLGLQVAFGLLGLFERLAGVDFSAYFEFVAKAFSRIALPLNMTAIGLFFAALGYKSGTVENPDARRRLKLMWIGTTVAMTPSFLIILYRVISGGRGSFFDLVPFWLALLALCLTPLFPLTMAYVIVVQRALDVRVVIRQGLQYALAKNGVFVLQILLSIGVVAAAASAVAEADRNRPQKITFVALGAAAVFLIRLLADKIKKWFDKRFFREAYNAEQILSDLSEDVRTMVETKPLLEIVSGKISESLHVPQIALLLKNGGAFRPAYALGYDETPPVSLGEDSVTIEKLKRNETLVIYQDDEESWVNGELAADERDKLKTLNSQLLLPVGAKNGLAGMISLSPKLSEEPYSANDLRLLKSVAAQTGLALENSRLTEAIAHEAAQKERLNRELEIAREVQERLFPQEFPLIQDLDYIGACRPALGVGGDYYDFLELPDKKLGIAIGDVSGKGIGASLMMASLQASLRGQAIHCGEDLAELMKHVNTLLYDASTSNRYATFFYAQYDSKNRKLIYVNAGHNPPYLLRAGGEVVRLEDGGAVVGMLPSLFVNYQQGEIQLEKGDLLVGYTDGISEAMNPLEEEWSEDAMLEVLKKIRDRPAEEILNTIVAAADRFADGAKQHDDMTMIIVKLM